METKDKFNELIDQADLMLYKAEQLAWNEIHKFEDKNCKEADIFWEMQSYASKIRWYINQCYPECLQ